MSIPGTEKFSLSFFFLFYLRVIKKSYWNCWFSFQEPKAYFSCQLLSYGAGIRNSNVKCHYFYVLCLSLQRQFIVWTLLVNNTSYRGPLVRTNTVWLKGHEFLILASFQHWSCVSWPFLYTLHICAYVIRWTLCMQNQIFCIYLYKLWWVLILTWYELIIYSLFLINLEKKITWVLFDIKYQRLEVKGFEKWSIL